MREFSQQVQLEASILAHKFQLSLKLFLIDIRIERKSKTHLELVVTPHREKDLSNPHTSCGSMSFAVGSPHSGLEPEQDHLIY